MLLLLKRNSIHGDYTMNKITAVIAASALIASSTFAFAGGPVEVQEEEQVIVVANPSSGSLGSLGGGGGAAVAALGVLAVGAALANSDSGSH
jgi:hypothetical protein